MAHSGAKRQIGAAGISQRPGEVLKKRARDKTEACPLPGKGAEPTPSCCYRQQELAEVGLWAEEELTEGAEA